MLNKPLDEFLISDWIDAMKWLPKNRFNKMRKLAERAGIEVPAICYGFNFRPRVTFEFPNSSEIERYNRVQNEPRLEKFNKSVEEWAKKVRYELAINAPRSALKMPRSQKAMLRSKSKYTSSLFNIDSEIKKTLSESITTNIRYDKKYKAEATNVGFNFSRYGIYLHYGAGRGMGGLTGSKWTDRYGRLRTTDQRSMGEMGTGSRPPIDWFNPVLKRNVAELADIAADYCADMTVNLSRLFLPII